MPVATLSPSTPRTSTRVRKLPRPADAPWLSPKEAAAYLGVGIDTIYDACASRGLRSVKIGHSTLKIKRAWVDDWMAAQEQR